MIKSIQIGEGVSCDNKIINNKKSFTSLDPYVYALIKLGRIKKNTKLVCTWSKKCTQEIFGIYEIPLKKDPKDSRTAVVGLDLTILFNENILNDSELIVLTIQLDEFILSEEIYLKNYNTTYISTIKNRVPIHSREWTV